jgi:hypothetical protein
VEFEIYTVFQRKRRVEAFFTWDHRPFVGRHFIDIPPAIRDDLHWPPSWLQLCRIERSRL